MDNGKIISNGTKAVLFKSIERFDSFRNKLNEFNVDTIILDFKKQDWYSFDYSTVDFIIYFPSFLYSSNSSLALQEVYDNLIFINEKFPSVRMFPDPRIIKYYNDKYRQFLFLQANDYLIPKTIPLFSQDAVDLADNELGYPMVIKNRYGAGGGAVFRVESKKQLQEYFNISTFNFFNLGGARYFFKLASNRLFLYNLIKAKKCSYPFYSPPLLAQKFLNIDRDLKTVTGNGKVVEAHWRLQANKNMWKMNIDDGGIGEWSHIPQKALDLSVRLASDLGASWLNIDFLMKDDAYYISEFSPVWHHYAYKEKSSFIYKEDYNINVPLEESLDLERIIIDSLIKQ